ncbi:hypothetical protein [Rhodanobacter caeni]|uniref:Uncharacterized protein n=1 Tax=Rhodanobacter caeni TaxID=657654 RepID=A0ABP3E5R3_9GAMM
MSSSKTGKSVENALVTGEPTTRFFYEFHGERTVDPLLLVNNGIDLWQEQVDRATDVDNWNLWDFAESLLEDRRETPVYSWTEWLRYHIITGDIYPDNWAPSKPYPYKGLLVSAIYFQEARRLCLEGNRDRAWHLLPIAYYYLGMNTTASVKQNASRAARLLHSRRSEKLRALVLGALELIERRGSARSIKEAKDEVYNLIEKKKGSVKEWLDEFDASIPEKTKGRTQDNFKNDVMVRLRNLLDTWSMPSGPYPDISEAFSKFSKKRRAPKGSARRNRVNGEEIKSVEKRYFLRIVNILDDDEALIVKFLLQD